MKKLWMIPLVILLLAGCGREPIRETISDVQQTPVETRMQRVLIQLPKELSAPTLQNEETGTLYLCDDYAVTIHTVKAGDLNKTIRDATGMDRENLQILQTKRDGNDCYQWVWAVGGETGIRVGRGCILDDGAYHYVLTALADEDKAGNLQTTWLQMFKSFGITKQLDQISSGS